MDEPPAGDDWNLATYPKAGITHLWIDGYLSNASETGRIRHLVHEHLARLQLIEKDWILRTRCFSYFGAGRTYNGWSTTASVESHVQKLTRLLLDQEYRRARWTITAYSLGTIVTLITLGRLARQIPNLRKRVPLVVLIAPVLEGAADLFEYYSQETSDTPFGSTLPAVMYELRSEEQRHPTEARQAIETLLEHGVAIAVLHYDQDGLAPYTPIADDRILHRRYTSQRSERSSAPIRAHFEARTNPSIHDTVYHLAKPVVTLTKRR